MLNTSQVLNSSKNFINDSKNKMNDMDQIFNMSNEGSLQLDESRSKTLSKKFKFQKIDQSSLKNLNLNQIKLNNEANSELKNLQTNLNASENKLNFICDKDIAFSNTTIEKCRNETNSTCSRNLSTFNFSFHFQNNKNNLNSKNEIKSVENQKLNTDKNHKLFKSRFQNQFLLKEDEFQDFNQNKNLNKSLNGNVKQDFNFLNRFNDAISTESRFDKFQNLPNQTNNNSKNSLSNKLHDFNTSKGIFASLSCNQIENEEQTNSVNFNISLKEEISRNTNQLNFTFQKYHSSSSLNESTKELENVNNDFEMKSFDSLSEVEEEGTLNNSSSINFDIFN